MLLCPFTPTWMMNNRSIFQVAKSIESKVLLRLWSNIDQFRLNYEKLQLFRMKLVFIAKKSPKREQSL
jgi:hypothetical protein